MTKKTKKNIVKKRRARLGVILILFLAIAAARYNSAKNNSPSETSRIATGKPIGNTSLDTVGDAALLLVKHPQGINSAMIEYEGFRVSFNPDFHQPNYSAWILTADRTDGEYNRKNADFMTDPDVKGCPTLNDYRNSGFDRGHMTPAADMKWSKQAMADCHYLTNICPQDNKVNAGAWATIEKKCRQWAIDFGSLYIIAGPVLNDKLTRSIGDSKIPVPERFFKVIIAPEANPPKGIAFLMPNHPFNGGAFTTVTSIDNIEKITGFDFFYTLPDETENIIEAQESSASWLH